MSVDSEKILLGDLITYKKGFAFKSKDYVDKGIAVIRVSNFTDNSISKEDLKFVSDDVAKINTDVNLVENDIVIATVGSWPNNPASVVGRTISVPLWAKNALMNQNAVIIRAKSQSFIDQKFIYYQMKTDSFSAHIISKAQGSANQASITLNSIFSYPVNWLNNNLRTEIVNILSSLDNRISLLRETNTTLEAIAQTLFKSWFVDFDPVKAKVEGRLPEGMDEATAALFPSEFEESALGLIPKGWRVGTLNELCKIASGKRPINRSDNEVQDASIPLYGGAGTMGFTSESLFHEPKILTGRVGTLGKVHLVHPPFWASDNVLVLSPIESRSFLFCFHWVSEVDVYALNRGSTQPLLTQKDLGNQQRTLPTDNVLDVFSEIVDTIYEKIRLNVKQSQTLTTLRDTLLPRLISGQLHINQAQDVINEVGA